MTQNKKKLIAYIFVAIMVLGAFAVMANYAPSSNAGTGSTATSNNPSDTTATSGATTYGNFGVPVNFPTLTGTDSSTSTACAETTTSSTSGYPAPDYPAYPSYPSYPSASNATWVLSVNGNTISSGTSQPSDITYSESHSQRCTHSEVTLGSTDHYYTHAYSYSHSTTSWDNTVSSISYTFCYDSITKSSGNTWEVTVDSSSASGTLDLTPIIDSSSSLNPSDAGQSVTFTTTLPYPVGSDVSYAYTLYDGDSSSDSTLDTGSGSSFSYSFSSSGTYLLKYSLTNSTAGYTVSTELNQSVNTDPSITISSSQNPTDVGKSVTLTATGSGGTGSYSYQWYLNSNAISGATFSTYTTPDYPSSGTYDYYVAVTDSAGYTVDSNTISETANSDPTVSASANVTSADINYPIEFSASPSGGTSPYTYSWTIGGTQVSTSQDFSHSFSTAGTYTVEATVTDSIGETYSSSISITIHNNPAVSITSSQNPTDVGNSVTYTASESGGTGTISYAWYINGASEGSGSTLSYAFSSAGTYTVEVIVTDSDGHTASSSITETVYSDPSVSVSSSQNPTDVGNSVTFTATPSGGSGSYTYQWYVNGAAVSDATSSTYTTSFSSSGTEEIYVIIHDSVGNSAQSSTLDETVNADPSVSISTSQNPTDIGNAVTFTASGSGGTGSYSYQWYLNGNAVSGATSSTYSTSFSSSGSDTVYVVLTDSVGNSATSSTITETVNPDPSVSISSSQNPTDVGNSVTFTASGSGGTGGFTYAWYLNGATQSSTSSTFSYSFSSAGTYYVNVTVKDSLGDSSSYSFTETVYSDPSVSISSSQNPTDVGNSVTFTSSSSGGSGDYTFQWYLNGNAVSGATSSTYTTSFASAGTDSIYVIIHDSVGNSAQSSTITETVNADPSVSISSSQNPTDVGNSVTFTATPSGGSGSYTYQWYLNGDAVSGATSSTYATSFSTAGTDSLYLVITDSVGNTATSSNLTETVNSDPSVTISSSQNPTDIGNSVTFTASGSGGTGSYSYQWYYGNGTAIKGATGYQYSTSFSSSGTYAFYVVLTDSNGNTATSSTVTETVNKDPSVTVSESPSPTDANVSVTFTSTASYGTGSYTYSWAINGITYSTRNVTVAFTSSGTYTADLTVTDSIGNTATTSETIIVNPDPTVSIIAEYSTVNAKTNDTLTASAEYGTGAYNYTWYNGSTVIGYGHSIVYKWGSQGDYTISVTLTDSLGETATNSITINVVPQPDISISGPLGVTVGNSNTWSMVASNVTTGGHVSWLNDGTATNDTTPFFTFTYPDANANETIEVSYDAQGVYYNSSITVHVYSGPAVSISAKYLTVDAGVADSLSAITTGGTPGYTYSWIINGHSFNSKDVSYAFSDPGTYNIKITATDGDGVSSSSETNITVVADPAVSITSSSSQYDAGYSITFTATGSGGTGSYSYQWYVNGNAVSGATSSTYTTSFSTAGTESVYVVMSDNFISVNSNVLSISIVKDPSVHVSASRTNIDSGQSIAFSAGVLNGTSPFTYSWTINGGSPVSTLSSFSYVFTTPGTYAVEASIRDANGFTAVSSLNITVNSDPAASAKASYHKIDEGATETFTATASGGYGSDTYNWILDGNTISTSSSFTYVFNSAGNRTVEVIITDGNEYKAYANVTVIVVPHPYATITKEYSNVDTGISDLFNSTVYYGVSPYNYTWDVNGIIEGYNSFLSYVFTSPGTYYVNLTVRDYFGYSYTASRVVYVDSQPVASIYANRTAIDSGMSISFISGVSGGNSPYNYTWYINGGIVGYGTSLHYTFDSPGIYNVSLKITDKFGESNTKTITITVNPPLTVKITASSTTIDKGQDATFIGNVSGGTGPLRYSWEISGGIIGSSHNITYPFSDASTYTVTLTVTDSLGVSQSYTVTETVNPALAAKISVEYSTVDENITDNITLSAYNGTSPYSYEIFINGVFASSSNSYSKYFTSPGVYSVLAYVNDSRGESITLTSTITVRSNPSIYISTPTNETDANVPVPFRSIISGGTGPYTYSWLIAGHTYSNATLSHAFSSPGDYSIQVTVTDAFGRQATATIAETIFPDPHATLVAPSYITASLSTPLSLNISGGIPAYAIQWYFPSGEQVSGNNIYHAFSTAGPDTFEVKISDSTGYVDVQNFTENVHLFVAIAANETSGLGPLSVQFSSSVLGGSGYSYNWTLSPGHYSLEQNPAHTFPMGNYTVLFTVTSSNGATGSATLRITSLPPPVSISYSTNKNITQYFYFNATANWDAKSPYNMTWSFPNGQNIQGMDIKYKFPVYNELNTVIATFSYDGKTYSETFTVRMVPARPVISFTPPSVLPVDTMYSLNATASAPDSNSFTYSYVINGVSYSGQTQLYYFSSTGNYTISVTATDSLGASSSVTKNIDVLPLGKSSSIAISYSKSSNGPEDYYTVKVLSTHGIVSVEAFMSSQTLVISETNSTYTPAGEVAYFNLTMDQRDYATGTYSISIVAFNNQSQSNHISIPFTVTSQYSSSTVSFGSIISFFGGISNFLITVLTFAGIGIAWASLRREDNPDVTIVEGTGKKTKRIRLQGKKVK